MADLLQVILHKQGVEDVEDPHVEDPHVEVPRAENPHVEEPRAAEVEEPVRTTERKVLSVV